MLVLVRGVFPPNSAPELSIAGVPLIVIALIIVRDLSRRSTGPSTIPKIVSKKGFKEDPVKFLGGQIKVAANSSDSYFDNVVRSRLRELLISKMALETGYDLNTIRGIMSDPKRGSDLLGDHDLYMMLYGQLPDTTYALRQIIEDAIDLIGAWKA